MVEDRGIDSSVWSKTPAHLTSIYSSRVEAILDAA